MEIQVWGQEKGRGKKRGGARKGVRSEWHELKTQPF